jgi:hypothetical protein
MKPKRVYIDTSVVGGCVDAEFRGASVALFERFRTGRLIGVVSDLTRSELDPAPMMIRAVLQRIPARYREDVRMNAEALRLAELYIAAGVIPQAMSTDARHIATATVHAVDVLASWNFKHIVNARRIHGYNVVNQREGYPAPGIRTPAEIIRNVE